MTYSATPSSPEQLAAKAAGSGRVVVHAEPNQLFIDLDSEESLAKFYEQIDILEKYEQLARNVSESNQPGHYHAVVTLDRVPHPFERVALQAALGSDRKRELLALIQKQDGNPGPNVFFERSGK